MKRSSWWLALALLAVGVASAQTPPANAKNINAQPEAVDAAAPSATIKPPASVLRIYINPLSGLDAAALNGLVMQTLFQSQQVVVTTNQSNASLILQGRVLREPAAAATPPHRRRPRAKPPAGINGNVTDITALGNDGEGATAAASPLPDGDLALSGLSLDPNAPVNLNQYRYQLQLQAVNPDGDVVWMSGQGDEALPFLPAAQAVAQTLKPFLQTVTALKAGQP